jgi:hypothetical protein
MIERPEMRGMPKRNLQLALIGCALTLLASGIFLASQWAAPDSDGSARVIGVVAGLAAGLGLGLIVLSARRRKK